MTVALYMNRCKDLGLSFDELDMINSGEVWDMLTEKANDQCEYPLLATQEQFHEFIS